MGAEESNRHEQWFLGHLLPLVDRPFGHLVVAHGSVFDVEGVAIIGRVEATKLVFSLRRFRITGALFDFAADLAGAAMMNLFSRRHLVALVEEELLDAGCLDGGFTFELRVEVGAGMERVNAVVEARSGGSALR